MIKIQCAPISTLADLKNGLQGAVELEHSTIPPYLTAFYSLRAGKSPEIESIFHSIVVEEMLHMTIASNILIAIGGNPVINKPNFVPKYPGPLPMGVQGGLEVHLKKLSREQVHDAFMQIEEPEDPIEFPVGASAETADRAPETIGEFYTHLKRVIGRLGDGIFQPTRQNQQMLKWFGTELQPIVDVQSAQNSIDLIIEQGEGTEVSPVDPEGELAHFYKFSEIYHQRKLVKDPSTKDGWSYSGSAVTFSEDDVYDMIDDPTTSRYPEDSQAAFLSNQFNYSYTKLLNALHTTFNGDPGFIDHAVGLMYNLKMQAIHLMETPAFPTVPNGPKAGPSFEYQPLNL